jgi:hypothetical protein
MLALLCVTMAVLVGGFLFTKVGQEAWIDAALSSPFSGPPSEQREAGIMRMAPYAGYLAVAQMLIFMPVISLVIAGILFAIFNAAMGGNATFKQQFAVVVHAGVVSVAGQFFTVPMNYARATMSSATNLGVLLPMIDETSFLGRLLGMVDLFVVWWVIVLAIGMGVLYRRKTQPIAMSFFGVYAVIALVVAFIRSR